MSVLLAWASRYLWAGAAIAGAALLLALSVQTHRVKTAKAETAEVRTAWTLQRAQATEAALAQATAYRVEEQRRQTAHQEIINEADRKILAARADAVIADAASGRLQQRTASLVAAAREAARHPGTAVPSAPAGDPVELLANLQRRADQAAGDMARIADERGAAGSACEAAYDSLTQGTP